MIYELERLNNEMRADPAGFAQRCDANLDQRLKKCAAEVAEHLSVTPTVLLSGPSAAGKTTAAGMLEKQESSQDRRVTLLRLTAGGMECVDTYVIQLHSRWAKKLQDVSGGQVREAVQVIKRLWETIPGKRGE